MTELEKQELEIRAKDTKNRVIQTLASILYTPTLEENLKKETEAKLLELVKSL